MIRLLTAVLLVASFDVMAQKLLLNEFEDGKPAKAAEVNYNFDALNNQIDSNDDEFEQFRANTEIVLPPSDCSTDQIIKWDGSAWVCANQNLNSTWTVESKRCYCPEDMSCERALFCRAYCPLGTTLTGGGCDVRTGLNDELAPLTPITRIDSHPGKQGDSMYWECNAASAEKVATDYPQFSQFNVNAYAICL